VYMIWSLAKPSRAQQVFAYVERWSLGNEWKQQSACGPLT
jgi:hypothetical protein